MNIDRELERFENEWYTQWDEACDRQTCPECGDDLDEDGMCPTCDGDL